MSRLLTRPLTPLLRSTPTVMGARAASGGQPYNPPTGYLFGEKPPAKGNPEEALTADPPPPPASVLIHPSLLFTGQKRVREDWELIFYWGFGGGLALAAVLKFYQPDTSLEGWARKEAKAKMAAAGETPSYTKS
ncbi:BQ2448_1658 [Microbotryum intermedium]|uniref:NADH dehydrogenase [ubiquinone] 1 beta subcomplex subunit 11, mitochondrial n=1 Tax=Microbotryum intermedium TaxID=269621 RepID=A0A238FEF9_9BASI|nr:BQ2448_1658 [Microbotryum intermedium]